MSTSTWLIQRPSAGHISLRFELYTHKKDAAGDFLWASDS